MFNHLAKISQKRNQTIIKQGTHGWRLFNDFKHTKYSLDQKRKINILKENEKAKIYNFDEIHQIINNSDKNKKVVLIDVREPSEYQKGFIPTAINLPYNTSPESLQLSPEKFKSFFKIEKPKLEDTLIFYCFLGVRSSAAEQLASIFGYRKRGVYLGSYKEWVKCAKTINKKF